MTTQRLAGDYYIANENQQLAALRRRVAALERALGIVPARIAAQGSSAVAMPDALLPAAADIPELLLLDKLGGGIYRLELEIVGGRARLLLAYIGHAREE